MSQIFQAFWDYGICRCLANRIPRYGRCVKLGDLQINYIANRTEPQNCFVSYHCETYDMNMVCKKNKCVCRDLMKWNEEALECQVFIDFNCTGVTVYDSYSKLRKLPGFYLS